MEFTYFLADRLKMPVADLQDRMSNIEFLRWQAYHARKAQREELEQKKARHGR